MDHRPIEYQDSNQMRHRNIMHASGSREWADLISEENDEAEHDIPPSQRSSSRSHIKRARSNTMYEAELPTRLQSPEVFSSGRLDLGQSSFGAPLAAVESQRNHIPPPSIQGVGSSAGMSSTGGIIRQAWSSSSPQPGPSVPGPFRTTMTSLVYRSTSNQWAPDQDRDVAFARTGLAVNSSRPALSRNATAVFPPEDSPALRTVNSHGSDYFHPLENLDRSPRSDHFNTQSDTQSFSDSLDRQRALLAEVEELRADLRRATEESRRLREAGLMHERRYIAQEEEEQRSVQETSWGALERERYPQLASSDSYRSPTHDPYSQDAFETDTSRRRPGSFLSGRLRSPTYRRNQEWLYGHQTDSASSHRRSLPPLSTVTSRRSSETGQDTLRPFLARPSSITGSSVTSPASNRTLFRPLAPRFNTDEVRVNQSTGSSAFERVHIDLPQLSYDRPVIRSVFEQEPIAAQPPSPSDSSPPYFPEPSTMRPTIDDSTLTWLGPDSDTRTASRSPSLTTLMSRPNILRRRRTSSNSVHEAGSGSNIPTAHRSASHWFARPRLGTSLAGVAASSTGALPTASEREDDNDLFAELDAAASRSRSFVGRIRSELEEYRDTRDLYHHDNEQNRAAQDPLAALPSPRTTGLLRRLSFRRRERSGSSSSGSHIRRGRGFGLFGLFSQEFAAFGSSFDARNYMTDDELDSMGYDDLLRLADSVGPASDTQRLATHDDIERANLKCTFAGDLQNLPAHLLPTSETGQKCLICLTDYEASDTCRLLNCSHAYHKECIDSWLTTGQNNCPLCREKTIERVTPHPPVELTSGDSRPSIHLFGGGVTAEPLSTLDDFETENFRLENPLDRSNRRIPRALYDEADVDEGENADLEEEDASYFWRRRLEELEQGVYD